jgi:hypothetical protein
VTGRSYRTLVAPWSHVGVGAPRQLLPTPFPQGCQPLHAAVRPEWDALPQGGPQQLAEVPAAAQPSRVVDGSPRGAAMTHRLHSAASRTKSALGNALRALRCGVGGLCVVACTAHGELEGDASCAR